MEDIVTGSGQGAEAMASALCNAVKVCSLWEKKELIAITKWK